VTLVLAAFLALLFLGWCAGAREKERGAAKRECSCLRCWYVSEPPRDAPFCFRAMTRGQDRGRLAFLAIGGAALFGFAMLMRSMRKKASS
jgi:hypothetical protein